MERDLRPEAIELPSPKLQRTLSKSSDGRTPSISGSSFAPPPHIHPDPSYIASSSASTIVYNAFVTRGQHSPASDQDLDAGELTISPSALALVNAFLDQLLFGFLASARSTSILSLRPAISEILKPRLAKEASEGADEELKGYLVGGDDEELLDFHNGQEVKGEWNLHQTFRRTRLRCMVYTRLGDMEEEDEEELLEEEQSQGSQDRESEQHRLSRDLGNVSPAAAIFLTSILEFLGERALQIAGEAAFSRLGPKLSTDGQSTIVEERDVQKIAFNKTLGRLWRSWKAAPRASMMSPRLSGLYQGQRSSSFSASAKASRNTSISELEESGYFDDSGKRQSRPATTSNNSEGTPNDSPIISKLPEEPDFSWSTELAEAGKIRRDRPRSMLEYPLPFLAAGNDQRTESAAKEPPKPQEEADRPKQRRQRSSSLPVKQSPYTSPINETFMTPLETPDQFLSNRFNDAHIGEPVPKLTDQSDTVASSRSGNPAVSTMYDGALSPGTERFSEISTDASSRGVSMSDYSVADHDMTPQALSFTKPGPQPEDEPTHEQKSRNSTISSNYSFQGGEMSPLPTEKTGQDPFDNDQVLHSSSLPAPSDRLEQTDDRPMDHAGLTNAQADRLRTLDGSGSAIKRDIPHLYEAPSNKDVIYDAKISGQNLQNNAARSTPTHVSKSSALSGQGAPPLAPLQELLDAAHDTSDESSSLAPSYEASNADSLKKSQSPRQGAYPLAFTSQNQTALNAINPSKVHSNASQTSTVVSHRPSAATSKYVDLRNEPLAVNTGIERAAVQRVSPSSATARDLPSSFGRTSTSSAKGRPVSPGSTTSGMSNKIKGMMGRESNDMVKQPMPRRGSSEISDGLVGGARKATRGGGKEQDFEQLIRSDETIQYTLTPQNMREMEKGDSPRRGAQQSIPPPVSNPNGLRANPTNGSSAMTFSSAPASSPNAVRSHPQAPPKPSGNRTKSVIARDAAGKDNSMKDFADFIRSTGPDTDPKNMSKAMNTGAYNSIDTRNSSTAVQGTLSEKTTDKKTRQVPVTSMKVDSSLPARKSSKLKARDPTSPSGNMTADLADFLRSGPGGGPVDNLRQAQRSPGLAVATNGLSHGSIRDAMGSGNSVASTQDSFAASKMTQSSTNSHTGLLENSNRATAKNHEKRPARSDEAPVQARKQRRVKDPYAVESDDEDDIKPPPKISREEESLSDFLRDYHPPSSSTATRNTPPLGVNKQTSPELNQKQRKGSTTSLKDRLTRNIPVMPDYRSLPPKSPKKSLSKSPPPTTGKRQQVQRQHSGQSPSASPASSRSKGAAAPQLPPLNPRATSPHLVSQTGTKMDSYKPTRPTYAAHVERRPKQHLQAREELGVLSGNGSGGGGSGMSDLADFLRETEPPAPSGPIGGGGGMDMRPLSPAREKEGRGFGGMFGRRKKVAI